LLDLKYFSNAMLSWVKPQQQSSEINEELMELMKVEERE
jgi:hypothetical protein